MWQYASGLIRHALTTFGGGLVADGLLTGDDMQTAVSGLVVVAGVIWSLIEKKLRD